MENCKMCYVFVSMMISMDIDNTSWECAATAKLWTLPVTGRPQCTAARFHGFMVSLPGRTSACARSDMTVSTSLILC